MKIKFNEFLKEELTINEIQIAMDNGEITSKELVMYYLYRIAKYDQDVPKLNSIVQSRCNIISFLCRFNDLCKSRISIHRIACRLF